jgi:hypothetical protein
MMYRVLPLFLLALVLTVLSGAPVLAQDDTHEGTFVRTKGTTEFVMKDKEGKEHTHTLAADAKILALDGKAAKLADFKADQKIRVTTKKGDKTTALKVEAIK